jgi:hypothetical protein
VPGGCHQAAPAPGPGRALARGGSGHVPKHLQGIRQHCPYLFGRHDLQDLAEENGAAAKVVLPVEAVQRLRQEAGLEEALSLWTYAWLTLGPAHAPQAIRDITPRLFTTGIESYETLARRTALARWYSLVRPPGFDEAVRRIMWRFAGTTYGSDPRVVPGSWFVWYHDGSRGCHVGGAH